MQKLSCRNMRKLNCHSLLKDLNSLCKFLDETYLINRGGCCFLAFLISKHLDRLNIKYDLIIYDNRIRDRVCIEHEVINRHKNKDLNSSITGYHSCDHYCLQIKGAGVVNGNDYHNTGFRYTIPGISCKNIRWIYDNSEWNNCYKVQYNSTIKIIVKEFFKKYEKISNF